MAKSSDKPTDEDIEALPIEDKVKYRYEHGQGSIQDIARVYRLEVSEVLEMIGEGEMNSVEFGGDLITEKEAGPGATMNRGEQYDVPYSTN